MAFEMYYDDVDTEKVGGVDRVMPGLYHMLVEEVDEDGGKNGAMRVLFQVLRGTTPGQETKIFPMDFKKEYGEWPQRKLMAFAIGTGLRTKEQIDKAKAERRSDPVEWSEAVGKTCCMEIEADAEGQYKDLPKLSWDHIWHPSDKRASRVPLHAETVKRLGIKLPENRPIDGVLAVKPTAAKSSGKTSAKKDPAAASAEADSILDGVI